VAKRSGIDQSDIFSFGLLLQELFSGNARKSAPFHIAHDMDS